MVAFPPFRLDLEAEQLWKGSKQLALRRKPFAILRYLVANPRRLVTHDELMKHVWGDVHVSESAVRTHLHELRQALGEGVIETVVGRGYRFTANLQAEAIAEPATAALSRLVVGRAAELAQLRAAFDRARGGHRGLVFVTGEPGIGKTTLVDVLLDELEQQSDVLVARGHCIEQHGTAEPYMPVIELFGRLRRNERVLAELVRYAPTFLAQAPNLVPDAQLDEVLRRARGGSEGRMVREIIDAIEAVSVAQTLVLVLEDLQWADIATLDLVAALGQRRERAHLLVIGTARRDAVSTTTHPLSRVMRPLVARSGASAIAVEPIAAADVSTYLAQRFPNHTFPAKLAEVIDRITAGIPLFVSAIVDDLLARGMITDGMLATSLDEIAAHRADSVRQLIDIRLDRLTPEEQRVLEVGSVMASVSSALVAAALELSLEAVDDVCDDLARRSLFLRRDASEEWPDGSLHTRYAFTHGLVQEVCERRAATVRKQRWHRKVADRLEAAYGERTAEIAVTLAQHFQHAQVAARAAHYFVVAAERAQQRFASADAMRLYRAALDLLPRLAEPERDDTELRILGGMTPSVLRLHEEYVRDPAMTFGRRLALARKNGAPAVVTSALLDFLFYQTITGDHFAAASLLEQIDKVIADGGVPPLLVAHIASAHAVNAFWRGQLSRAIDVFERVVAEDVVATLAVGDRRVVHRNYLALTCCLLGQPDRALREIEQSTALATSVGDPYTLGLAHTMKASIHYMRRDPVTAIRASAQTVLATPEAMMWHPPAALLLAYLESQIAPLDAAAADRVVETYQHRIATFPLGATTLTSRTAAALVGSPRERDGLQMLDDILALSTTRGEHVYRADLLIQRGDMLHGDDAIAAYRDALRWARETGGALFELRAAMRLGDRSDVAAALAKHADGAETPDQVEARALLG